MKMHVANYIPVSLIDFPGVISSVVFTHGCNLLCRYCHNPELVNRPMRENLFGKFTESIQGKDIEGVAVTGGEPLVSKDILPFLKSMKDMGMKVKLDTNGSLPGKLREVCKNGLIDFASVDIKAFNDEDIQYITRTNYAFDKFFESIDVLRKNNISFEIRHTLWKIPALEDVEQIMERLGDVDLIVQFPVKNGVWLDKRFNISIELEDKQQIRDIFDRYGVKYRNLFD